MRFVQAGLAAVVVGALAFVGWGHRAFLRDVTSFASDQGISGIATAYEIDEPVDDATPTPGRELVLERLPQTTTTTLGIDLYIADPEDTREIGLIPLRGTVKPAQAIDLAGGSAVLGGLVVDAGGVPVPGATVRVDRFVENASASVDVRANSKGAWQLAQLEGGRYRVRAFAPPDLSQIESQTLFVAANANESLTLVVAAGGGEKMEPWASRSGFAVGETASIGIRLRREIVNEDGKIILIGRPEVPLRLAVSGALRGGDTRTSRADGTAAWSVRCVEPGPAGATIFVDGTPVDVGVPDCRPPAPPPTEAPTTTSAPSVSTTPPTTAAPTTAAPTTSPPTTAVETATTTTTLAPTTTSLAGADGG